MYLAGLDDIQTQAEEKRQAKRVAPIIGMDVEIFDFPRNPLEVKLFKYLYLLVHAYLLSHITTSFDY